MAGVDREWVEEEVMRRINADDEKECSCGAYSAGECCCDADWTTDELRCLRVENKALLVRVDELRAENAALQAKIDSLMLEYCPEEMTPEQLAEWAKHQKAVPPEESKRINAQIEVALQAKPAGIMCPRCGVDRLTHACPNNLADCTLLGYPEKGAKHE